MSDSTFWLENYSKLYVRVKFLYLFCELFLDYWGNVWDKRETKKRKDCGGRIKSFVGVVGERKSLRTSVSVSSSGKLFSTAK